MEARVLGLLRIALERLSKAGRDEDRLLLSCVLLIIWGYRWKMLHLLFGSKLRRMVDTIHCLVGVLRAVRSKMGCLLVSMDKWLRGSINP